MKKIDQPTLRMVVNNDVESDADGGGYKSGRNSCRETPLKASTAKTRSAGTRPVAIQREMLPCDLRPSPRASAVWPPTTSHALRTTDLDISPFNAQIVNEVNARRANALPQTPRMGRKAEGEPCDFWKRLAEAWGAKELPTSQNGVADYFGMRGNGSTGRWYRGDGLPETAKLIKMARVGGVTVDWLLSGNEPRIPVPPGSDLERLLNIWGALSPENRPHALRAAEGELARQRQEEGTLAAESEATPAKRAAKS